MPGNPEAKLWGLIPAFVMSHQCHAAGAVLQSVEVFTEQGGISTDDPAWRVVDIVRQSKRDRQKIRNSLRRPGTR